MAVSSELLGAASCWLIDMSSLVVLCTSPVVLGLGEMTAMFGTMEGTAAVGEPSKDNASISFGGLRYVSSNRKSPNIAMMD